MNKQIKQILVIPYLLLKRANTNSFWVLSNQKSRKNNAFTISFKKTKKSSALSTCSNDEVWRKLRV